MCVVFILSFESTPTRERGTWSVKDAFATKRAIGKVTYIKKRGK